jgi:hypothetical protein
MILADISTLKQIDDRLRAAGGPDADKASEEIRQVLYGQDKVSEDAFYRLLHSVWGCVTSALDRRNYNPQSEHDLERLSFELASAVNRHRTASLTPPLVRVMQPQIRIDEDEP